MTEPGSPRSLKSRLLREPLIHFFALGAILFAADHLTREDPHLILVSPGLKADLSRRFADQHGRGPTPKENDDALAAWKRDEALYREALRRGMDRNDAVVRSLLVDKMRAEAALDVSLPEPSDAELDHFLHAHRERYEIERRYDFQFLTFPKSKPKAEEELSKAKAALDGGARPSDLGRPLTGAKLASADLPGRVATELGAQIIRQSPGPWLRVEDENNLWLLRIRAISGGLPELKDVRERVLADFKAQAEEEATERKLQETADLYRFEESDAP